MRRFGAVFFALAAAIAPLAAGAGDEKAEQAVYRGRLFLGGGAASPGVIDVQITIDHLSTNEELAELAPLMAAGETNRLFVKAKAFKTGALQYLRTSGLRIDFNLAFEKKTEGGKRIFLVAENQSADPTSSLMIFGEEQIKRGLFLVVAIDLNEGDKGEGKIYQEARVKFSAGGDFELLNYRMTPLLIVNIVRK